MVGEAIAYGQVNGVVVQVSFCICLPLFNCRLRWGFTGGLGA